MPHEMAYCSLIVDIDTEHSRLLASLLDERHLNPKLCASLDEARTVLAQYDRVSIAFLALDLVNDNNFTLLEDLKVRDADVALMHSNDDPVAANKAIKHGATCFFCKPLDRQFISDLLDDIIEELNVYKVSSKKQALIGTLDQFGLMRGSSRVMYKLYRTIRKVAPTDASVLLVGESGTGKELAARTIHELSERREGPFVAMNCGAIAPDLAESELFGHEKGSFSGADKKHIGYFERAANGTLLLDEVGEMPVDLQVKLLRVLESRQFLRVGGEKTIAADVRIVAATNRDPEEAIRNNLLRKDLYFRIAQFPLYLPPLRDRSNDIIGLAQYFLNELNEVNDTDKHLSDDAKSAIASYSWPGNVRELKSAMERAYIMADSRLDAGHFPTEQLDMDVVGDYLRVSVGSSLEDTERKMIIATLESSAGDKKKTAEQLGISLKTLYNRLNEYEGH